MGGKLDRILWKGKQWAVTTYGIEALDEQYAIEKARLYETVSHGDLKVWEWPIHMGHKNWVDKDDFIAAFSVAMEIWPPKD